MHAGVFGKAQQRPLRIVEQRAGRAGGYAGEAERAALDVDLDLAERRARGERNDIDWSRRRACQLAQGEPHDLALAAERMKARRARRAVFDGDGAKRVAERVRIIGLDRRHARSGKAKPGQDRLRQPQCPGQAADVVTRFRAQQQPNRCRTIREGGGDRFETTWVTSLTAIGSTFAGSPSPKRASASISGMPWASSWMSRIGAFPPASR